MSEHSASALATRDVNALAAGDLDRARTLLVDDFAFQGPGMRQAVNRETFPSELAGKHEHVVDNGSRKRMSVRHGLGDESHAPREHRNQLEVLATGRVWKPSVGGP